MIEAPSLASFIGIESLWIKNETQNPTGSYKDRIAAVVTAKAVEAKAKRMVLVSSGNMAAATAAYGSVAGMETIVIVSPSVSREDFFKLQRTGEPPSGSGAQALIGSPSAFRPSEVWLVQRQFSI